MKASTSSIGVAKQVKRVHLRYTVLRERLQFSVPDSRSCYSCSYSDTQDQVRYNMCVTEPTYTKHCASAQTCYVQRTINKGSDPKVCTDRNKFPD